MRNSSLVSPAGRRVRAHSSSAPLRHRPEPIIKGCMRHNIRVVVSLPQAVVNAVNELAEQRGESRSHFIASLLARIVSAKRDREIRAEIDALFADPTVCAEQKDTAEAFLSVSPWQREKQY